MTLKQRRVSWRRTHGAILVGAGTIIGLAAVAQGMGSTSVRAEGTTTVTYTATGEHAFVVPSGVTSIHVVSIGASGKPGSGPAALAGTGGDGAMVSADLAVTPGQTVYAEVNLGGGPGGAGGDSNFNPTPTGGAGGGESDVRTCSASSCELSPAADPRLLVAGGGGGGAPAVNESSAVNSIHPAMTTAVASSGGAAGHGSTPCSPGSAGTKNTDSTVNDQGRGGTCFGGGSGGSSGSGNNSSGSPGGLPDGGQGGTTSNFGGGGGGAGFFGGGGGAADNDDGSAVASGAGGGGSSCAPCKHLEGVTRAVAVTPTLTNGAITSAGGASPKVTISWTAAVTPTPTATATPTAAVQTKPNLPSTGAGPISGAWEPLVAGGLVLFGLGAFAGRRRGGDAEAP